MSHLCPLSSKCHDYLLELISGQQRNIESSESCVLLDLASWDVETLEEKVSDKLQLSVS